MKKNRKKVKLDLRIIGLAILVGLSVLFLAFSKYFKLLYGSMGNQAEIMELGTNLGGGHRFAFVSHSRRELNDNELLFLSKNYDLIVLGNQTKPMDTEARKIKALNPNIKIFMYFPTAIRHKTAIYGKDTFDESWYLRDKSLNKIYIGVANNMAYIDLRNPKYVDWARTNINQLLGLADYDGVVFDNASPEIAAPDMVETTKTWGPALQKYIQENTKMLASSNKLLIFNGISRYYHGKTRNLDQMTMTSGALNEFFCYGRDDSGNASIFPSDLQLEDIELQRSLAQQGKYVFQKVNIPVELTNRYGKYCYGLFLMGNVPGKTFFKYGNGYNLNVYPEEYQTLLAEYSLDLGQPVAEYRQDHDILWRQYKNFFVVVNLGNSSKTWINPRDQKGVEVGPTDAIFVPVDKSIALECRKLCQTTSKPTGWCAFKPNACAVNGGVRMVEGDRSCPAARNICCCR